MMLGGKYTFAEPDRVEELADGQDLELAGLTFTVDHTPGHTRGSVTFRSPYDEQDISQVMFSGDLLFAGLHRPHRPPGRRPPDDAAQPAHQGAHRSPTTSSCCRATGSRRPSVASARPTPTCSSCRGLTRRDQPAPEDCEMSKPTPLSGYPEFLPAERPSSARSSRRCRARSSCTASPHRDPRRRAARPPLQGRDRQGGLRAAAAPGRDDERRGRLGLHFDLTVPLARYVLENQGRLDFPFRRYQIQTVCAGSGPQGGRFREFTQADVDIMGRDTLGFDADIEVTEGDGRGARAGSPVPPLHPARQQPQAHPGLLPRARDRRHGGA